MPEVSSVSSQQVLRHQHTAFQRFSAGRAKYPRSESRADRQSAHYTRSALRMRGGRLRLAQTSAPLGEFRRQLEYETERVGKRLVVIDRWYPSSEGCSTCGHLLQRLKLSVRVWLCPHCRTRHDRDDNAATSILAAGRAVATCGADVGRDGHPAPQSATKQEPTGASPTGLPVP